ncbi:MAG: DinB family protein [Acidimicrobiales bacterium]|nr:DinB family protein [Acidimicrobiales bacterium]
MERTDPDLAGDEPTMLGQYLDHHRATLMQKASGLTREQLATRLPTSDLTLAGLVKHAALNEDHWFGVVLLGRPPSEPWATAPWNEDPDWEFHTALDDEPAELLALYDQTCARSRDNVAEAIAAGGLDVLSAPHPRRDERFSLRWILLHMLEETARHNGHADLLREAADGATGE